MDKILYILMLFLCISCKSPKTIYVPVEKTNTEYIVNTDSVYIHDSIFYFINTKNDTTIIHKYTEHIREFYKTDTLIQKDTVPIILEVEKYTITNLLYNWQKVLIALGILFSTFIIYKVIKILRI